jgi:hypothetical protein
MSFLSSISVILFPLYPFNHIVNPSTTQTQSGDELFLLQPSDTSDNQTKRHTKDPALHDKRLLDRLSSRIRANRIFTSRSRIVPRLDNGSRKLLLQLLVPRRIVIFARDAVLGSSAIGDLVARGGRDDVLRAISDSIRSLVTSGRVQVKTEIQRRMKQDKRHNLDK